MGPHNPNQKPALVAVTRGGMIRLMFQEKNLRWQDMTTELDSISTSSGLLSHAAMTADKGWKFFIPVIAPAMLTADVRQHNAHCNPFHRQTAASLSDRH